MLAQIYRPEAAGIVKMNNGDVVQIGFVTEGQRVLTYIFCVELDAAWHAFDVRKVEALASVFKGASLANRNRIRLLGVALGEAFASREALAAALSGTAEGMAPLGVQDSVTQSATDPALSETPIQN